MHNVLLTRRKSSSGHDGWGQEVAITADPSPFPGRHSPSSEDSQDWAHGTPGSVLGGEASKRTSAEAGLPLPRPTVSNGRYLPF